MLDFDIKSPLTKESGVELVRSLSPEKIAHSWQSSMGVDVGDAFLSLPKIDHWRCLKTGIEWYTPSEAAGEADLYAQLERLDWYYMDNKWEFHEALRHIEPGSKTLEIGVGFGAFLKMAVARGAAVTGVELNPSAADRVRRQGFRVLEKDLRDLAKEEKYDVVCSFQVLEHISDPRRFLEGILSVLRPGGRLILSVPNAAVMRVIDPQHQDLLDQPPHHVSHWDEGVFRSLESILPVRVCSSHNEPLQAYHVDYFVTSYFRTQWQKWFPDLPVLLSKFIFNRWTLLPISLLLKAGVRSWIPGHTLLIVLEHQPQQFTAAKT